jgi:hypothetical protein
MKTAWTADEDDLLLSLLPKWYYGGRSEINRTWAEITELMDTQARLRGINLRTYTSRGVQRRYREQIRPQLRRQAEQAATVDRVAPAEMAINTFPSPREEFVSQKPTLQSLQIEPSGPPVHFEEYKDPRGKEAGQ